MDRFRGLISKKDGTVVSKVPSLQELLAKADTKKDVILNFDRLVAFVDEMLVLAEKSQVSTNEYGDTFKYSSLGRKVVNRRLVNEGIEEVALVREEALASNSNFSHLFAKSEEGVVGSNDIIIGVVRLDGEELRSRMGESTRTYTGDELKKVIINAYGLCMIDW